MSEDHRIKILRSYLKKYKLDTILISDATVAEYICGFHSSNIYLLISQKNCFLLTDFRYQEAAENFCAKNKRWKCRIVENTGLLSLRKFLTGRQRVGIQADKITLFQFEQLQKKVRNITFKKLDDRLTNALASVKKQHEIEAMQEAAAVGDKAFFKLLPKIRTGMTEKCVAEMLEDLCKKYGSEKPSFDTIVLFGPNSALPHGRPSDRKLKKGDWILFDFGCTVRGFCSDMTRTIVFGKANDRQKQIYSIVRAAQAKAKQKIRPGIQACEIDMCARAVIDKAGYGATFGHATGHGVGLQIHESPRIFKNNTTTVVPNMVVTVEPGIYLSGFGGVRIEDMVVVTKKGYRSLTRTPRTLLECT